MLDSLLVIKTHMQANIFFFKNSFISQLYFTLLNLEGTISEISTREKSHGLQQYPWNRFWINNVIDILVLLNWKVLNSYILFLIL